MWGPRRVQQSVHNQGSTGDEPPGVTATTKFMRRRVQRLQVLALALVATLGGAGWYPSVASAHGPIAPIATSYEARIARVPPGVEAKVIDGDQRMWLRVSSSETLVVLDYRGAPYLRFSTSGVAVNRNSAMHYLNQTPAELPPSNLGPATAPRWSSVVGGHEYSWHDGRLHALATVAQAPGASYVGRWTIPARIDGRSTAIAGELWHADDPSVAWFWPIVVLVACTLAAWRVGRPEIDALAARVLGFTALIAIAGAAVARDLRGRPEVSVFQLIAFTAFIAFVFWGLRALVLRRAGYFSFFAIAFVAIYQGGQLVPALLNGFVLAAVPAFVARAIAVVCLGCGGGLLLLAFRLADQAEPDPAGADEPDDEISDELDAHDAGAGRHIL